MDDTTLDCAMDMASETGSGTQVDVEVCRVFSRTWRAVAVPISWEPLTMTGRPAPLGLKAGVVALKIEEGFAVDSVFDPK